MPKFEVKKADDQTSGEEIELENQDAQLPAGSKGLDGDITTSSAEGVIPDMDSPEDEEQKNLYLFQEDMKNMPRVGTFLKGVLSYHTTHPNEKDVERSKKQAKKAKLGVVLGVYLPTIQHIFGVLMFVRLAWIVGHSGTIQAFFMVFVCCLTTFVTAISMSAIATNGVVQAGGSYFMISRNLGPESGGAVGICFYLANTFAVDLYTLGAIEILLQYIAPSLAYFGDIHHNPWNNFRLYGTLMVLLLTFIVAVGVKFVAVFAPFSLACVIVSIICVFIGSFEASASTRDVMICMLGDRLLVPPGFKGGHGAEPDNASYSHHPAAHWCTKNSTGDLFARYCTDNGSTVCDEFFTNNEVRYIPGIPGMASGVIKDNLFANYLAEGEVTPGVKGDAKLEVVSDMSTNFIVLAAIYFPSVTGIMTGSNMSGDLRDPQKSIPIGTILAQLTCSFVYLSFVLLFGSTTAGPLLRDKFGVSLGGSLLVAKLAWPNQWVLLIGAFCSTVGAALQCLTSAPRLLQAIARDNIIPFLDVFRVTTKNGEPLRALIITALIAEIGIIIASLDYVAPVIDVFFLMCYMFVNLTCALQTLLKTPNWRPRFKYYHWSLSLLGVFLNLVLSIIAGWYYALSAFVIAAFIYKYVEYKGGEKEWGDGISGLSMSAAQRALLKLDEEDPHTKNWRPQLLVLCKLTKQHEPKYRRIFSLASQLKAGKGLTVVASVIPGTYAENVPEARDSKEKMKQIMIEEKVKGFAKLMVTKDITEGLNIYVQTIGLGGMRHNTVLVGWPYEWRQNNEERSWKVFLDTVRAVQAKELALLVPKNITNFPHNKERLRNSIDIWWIVHDGGMLILISFLLKQHKVWKNCKLRIFTVAQMTDNSIQLKKDLEMFLYQLRIHAEVHIEEMYDSDISAYTVERTLDMEKRASMLKDLKVRQRRPTVTSSIGSIYYEDSYSEISLEIQEIMDASHNPGSGVKRDPSLKRKDSGPGQNKSSHVIPTVTVSIDEETNKYEIVDEKKSEGSGAEVAGGEVSATGKEKPPTPDGVTPSAAPSANQLKPNNGEAGVTSTSLNVQDDPDKLVHFTFTPSDASDLLSPPVNPGTRKVSVAEGKLMRMHTAVKLNNSIRAQSGEAELVIINFPAPPAKLSAEENYMEYLEALTEGLDRVLMVRGSGKEVVTIFS